MRITALETIQTPELANLVWVRLHTDSGLIGLGETFRNPQATIAYLHETCAPYLLGKDPIAIERHWHALMYEVGNHFHGYPTRSVELRGNSAVDLALWDLWGQSIDQPVWQLLGGRFRDKIRVYNTCASAGYNTAARTDQDSVVAGTSVSNDKGGGANLLAADDLRMQIEDPAGLARSLLEQGISGMKIWPFDRFAQTSGGHHITAAQLDEGVGIVAKIRDEVGDAMDIMLEYHGLWHLPAALEIADALEPYDIYWHEDPIAMHNFDDLMRYKRKVKGRVCGSENLGTTAWYKEVLGRGAIDVVHFDLCWIGGLTEGRRVAVLANVFDRPIAPHDCVGPVTYAASVALVFSQPNALIQESVRAYYDGYYRDIVTQVPPIECGLITPLNESGLGTALRDDFLARPDLIRRQSVA